MTQEEHEVEYKLTTETFSISQTRFLRKKHLKTLWQPHTNNHNQWVKQSQDTLSTNTLKVYNMYCHIKDLVSM